MDGEAVMDAICTPHVGIHPADGLMRNINTLCTEPAPLLREPAGDRELPNTPMKVVS